MRKLRPEVERKREQYETRLPEKPPKWKPPTRPTRVKMKAHLAGFPEVPALSELAEGDVVYLLHRGSDYNLDYPGKRHRFPLYQVMEGGITRRLENGEYHEPDFERSRYFWFKKVPRAVAAPAPPASLTAAGAK